MSFTPASSASAGVQSRHNELMRLDRRSISPSSCEWVMVAYIWVVRMFLCPSSLLIVSIATPCDSVIVVAKVWRAAWNVIGFRMPAPLTIFSRQMLHHPLLGRSKIRSSRACGAYLSRIL